MRTHTLMVLAAAPLALALVTADAGAQRTTRRQQPIEIRGQVPTPQVVTVRPREVPTYNRRFLVPDFYDHDFWPAILPGYQLVSRRLVAGNVRLDSLAGRGADSARRADSTAMMARGRAAIGIGLMPRPVVDTTRRMMMPADTTRRAAPATATPPATPPGSATPPAAGTATPPSTGGTPPASGRR